jgi:hypothetical protein
MARTTKFNSGRNNGTGICEHCGKRTWKEKMECATSDSDGYCERCFTIFSYDNQLSDCGPDSDEGKNAIRAIKNTLAGYKDYPVFKDRGMFNSRITEEIVKDYLNNQETKKEVPA